MKIIPLIGTLLERHKSDNAKASAEKVEAVQTYNIMLGILEDPNEEIEEDEEEEEEDDE